MEKYAGSLLGGLSRRRPLPSALTTKMPSVSGASIPSNTSEKSSDSSKATCVPSGLTARRWKAPFVVER